jgi:hypothetical protein
MATHPAILAKWKNEKKKIKCPFNGFMTSKSTLVYVDQYERIHTTAAAAAVVAEKIHK